MRKLLASAALALSLSAPMVAMPSTAAAQPQTGLVNVSILDDQSGEIISRNNISVAAAVGVIANACDLVDVGEANILVIQALAADGTAVVSDCDQVADQNLTITESQQQRGGGRNR
jgi:hypothetical protein